MPQGQLVMRVIRRLLEPRSAAEATDAQLLERFVHSREERAFEALLDRYGPLVHGLCRRMLRHQQDAEDAFQATFLVLARKAGSIRKYESLSSWLYGVAIRVASRGRLAAARRRNREQPVENEEIGHSECDPANEIERRELDAVIDEEVQRLPEKYRLPVIRCCLQGKSNEDAAQELGWPLGTVQGRLARARELLKRRLQRRGVALGLGIAIAAASVPRALAHETLQAAGLFAEGAPLPATVTANTVVLTQGVLRTMFLAKLKLVAILVLAAAGIAGSSGTVGYRMAPLPAEPAQAATPLVVDEAEDQQDLVKVASSLDGVVRSVAVKVGSRVKKGQVLMQLDDEVGKAEVVIQEATLVSAEAELEAATALVHFREAQYQRLMELRKKAAVTDEAVRESGASLQQGKADLAVRVAALKIAKVKLERAKAMLDQSRIRSPVDGVVKAVAKKPGEALKRLDTAVIIRAANESK